MARQAQTIVQFTHNGETATYEVNEFFRKLFMGRFGIPQNRMGEININDLTGSRGVVVHIEYND